MVRVNEKLRAHLWTAHGVHATTGTGRIAKDEQKPGGAMFRRIYWWRQADSTGDRKTIREQSHRVFRSAAEAEDDAGRFFGLFGPVARCSTCAAFFAFKETVDVRKGELSS